MKRAQTIGQVFIFIMAGLVFILILAYGYRAVTDLLERGEEVQLLDFRNELESSIEVIKRDYGSVQRANLRMPSKTEEVCIVSSDYNDVNAGQLEQERPLFFSAWKAGSENVFLIPRQPTPIFIKDILVDDPNKFGFDCYTVYRGSLSLRVEGTGNKAKIKEWPQQQ